MKQLRDEEKIREYASILLEKERWFCPYNDKTKGICKDDETERRCTDCVTEFLSKRKDK